MTVPSAVKLRRATSADAGMIAELFTTVRRACMPYLPPLHSAEEDRQFVEGRMLAEREVWVAERSAGDIAGFMALGDELLDHLYVAQTHQSTGIGSLLLRKAMTLRSTGFKLWVFQQNERARQFYASHSLRLVKLTNGEDNEEHLPDALYEWKSPLGIDDAAAILRAGGLVAFPTETVYGLGADATNADAVRRIFAAKGRPATNPVIAHVADVNTARKYTTRWTDAAQSLATAFWPGPLTLVLPKTADIPDVVTAGKGTVGLRAPDHPLALELLRAFGKPVAAPSANRSNRISPTTAKHVRDELGESVDVILDGGPCTVGIESTVLDLSGDVPRILRPGGVSLEQIEAVIGRVELGTRVMDEHVPASSPGQHAVHYAPRTPAYRVEASDRDELLRLVSSPDGERVGLMTFGERNGRPTADVAGRVIRMPDDPSSYARHLYEILRDLDGMNLGKIFVEMPPATPAWDAVRDRLLRATTPRPV